MLFRSSVLDVRGADAVVEALGAVRASALAPSVRTYVEAAGLDPTAIRMGVVVQRMVPPVVSGVAFSRNPLSGLDEVVVECVPGRGDALVADGATPDLAELIQEVVDCTDSGHVFGGLSSGRGACPQWALNPGLATDAGVFQGGLSGVAFGPRVALLSRVTQGCQPISKVRRVTAWEGHVITHLDDEPALDVLLGDLNVDLFDPQRAVNAVRATLVGLSLSSTAMLPRAGQFGEEVMVRHIIGLDPNRRAVAIAQELQDGMLLAFCRRNTEAARADLLRIGAEIRETLEPQEINAELGRALADEATARPHPMRGMAGAIYVSCAGRGGPHFGAAHAEMQLVRRALGDVPLIGFFAGGEIAYRNLYGYTGVLTVFTGGEE